MRRIAMAIAGGGAAFAAFLLLLGPVNWTEAGGVPNPPGASPSAAPTTAPPCDGGGIDLQEILAWSGLRQHGYTTEIDWAKVPETMPRNAFSDDLVNDTDGVAVLIGDSAEVSSLVDDTLLAADADRARAGDGWTAIQLKRSLDIPLNYQLVGRTAEVHPSTASSGEVLWVYVPEKATCGFEKTLVIRAWCGNPVVLASKETE